MNFFDAMGMADKERIHSQFIFWFFNLDEKIVSDKIKSKILEAFLPDFSGAHKDFKAYSEKDNIDIIITTDKMALIIENKLKSKQHSNQTSEYVKVFKRLCDCDKEPYKFKRNDTKFVLLSLINETPESEDWDMATFESLLSAFKKVLPEMKDNIPETVIPEKVIIREYIKSIDLLIKNLDDFINNFYKYPQVFYPKKKDDCKDELVNYIRDRKYEIIFQKGFYTRIAEKMKNEYKIKEAKDWKIDHFTSEAWLEMVVSRYKDPKTEETYIFSLQFLNNDLRIIFKNERYEKTDQEEHFFEEGKKVFEDYNMNGEKGNYTKKILAPKNAYIYFIKTDGPKNFILNKFDFKNFDDYCQKIHEEIKEANIIMGKLKSKLDKALNH